MQWFLHPDLIRMMRWWNHDLPKMFTSMGIPVLTADSVPGVTEVDLSNSRLDIVNNYHARMLSSAVLAAESEHLEYVQIVSFGCGHDAYLSDEIIRMMKEISGKTPLILKLDEVMCRTSEDSCEILYRDSRDEPGTSYASGNTCSF